MYGASSTRRHWLISLAAALACTLAGPMARAQQVPGATTTTPVPREGSWMRRHEQFLDRARSGQDIDLLFLGDSITQGWDQNGADVWQHSYAPRHAANFGISGDRTQHVLWRIENGEIDGIHPKVVVLMIGTNNVRDNSADEIADGIKAIVATLLEKLPRTKILLLGVFPRSETPDAAREKLAAVNAKIARLEDDRVKFLDIGERFLNDDGTISRAIMPDFLHLSPRGYQIWADAMEPTLRSMLDEDEND